MSGPSPQVGAPTFTATVVRAAAAGRLGTKHNPRPDIITIDRDRGTPRGAAPPTPPGIRVTYHGGSTELSCNRNIELGETEGIEVVVAQGGLDRRVS